jgi:hypothetical protein
MGARVAALLVALAWGTPANAQQESLAAPAAADTEARKREAKLHFQSGLSLLDAHETEAALAEFRRSLERYPTRAATKNAAICLRALGRYDEALDLLEGLLALPDLPATDRIPIEEEIAKLEARVGTVVLVTSAPDEKVAAVFVDNHDRGAAPLPRSLRLTAGFHVVRVSVNGFYPHERQIEVAGGQSMTSVVPLIPIEPPVALPEPGGRREEARRPGASRTPRPQAPEEGFFLAGETGFAIVPSLGGEVAGACAGACAASMGLGFLVQGRGGYHFASGVEAGFDAGYLWARQHVDGRPTTVLPVGLPANPGTADDTQILRGALLGASAGLRLGARFPVDLRLGAGALLGAVSDHRSGHFTTVERPDKPATAYAVDVTQSPLLAAIYVAPEIRVGLRLGRSLELSFGIRTLVLFTPAPPSWSPRAAHVVAAGDGLATFPEEKLSSPVVVAITPGLCLRYGL